MHAASAVGDTASVEEPNSHIRKSHAWWRACLAKAVGAPAVWSAIHPQGARKVEAGPDLEERPVLSKHAIRVLVTSQLNAELRLIILPPAVGVHVDGGHAAAVRYSCCSLRDVRRSARSDCTERRAATHVCEQFVDVGRASREELAGDLVDLLARGERRPGHLVQVFSPAPHPPVSLHCAVVVRAECHVNEPLLSRGSSFVLRAPPW
jgi:hypothetical protein